MALHAAAGLAEVEHLLVCDGAGGLEYRVEQRGGVALGEDEPVVGVVLWPVEAVPQVLRNEDGGEVGGGHRGGGVARSGGCAGANRVDAQLLPKLTPDVRVVHGISPRSTALAQVAVF